MTGADLARVDGTQRGEKGQEWGAGPEKGEQRFKMRGRRDKRKGDGRGHIMVTGEAGGFR